MLDVLSWLNDHADLLMVLVLFFQCWLLWRQFLLSEALTIKTMNYTTDKLENRMSKLAWRNFWSLVKYLIIIAALIGLGVWIGSFFK